MIIMSAIFITEDGNCLNGPTGSKNPLPKPLFPLITKILLSFFILKSCNPSSIKIISGENLAIMKLIPFNRSLLTKVRACSTYSKASSPTSTAE